MSGLAAFLARHGAPRRLGVAVSGGGDSMALLVLAAEIPGVTLHAVTVDHGLRPEARDEAAVVAQLCAQLGIAHTLLRWNGAAAQGNLQAAARRARYALIAEWSRGLDAVLLGHTLDDQAETLLMRLARGSGVDGLSGMAEMVMRDGQRWLRPLLGLRRAALRDLLRARGLRWCEDPSNADSRFQRVRARQALAALAGLGVEPEGLARTAARLGRARRALEAQTDAALRDLAQEDRGTVLLSREALSLLPEIRDRVFARLVLGLSGAEHRPRLQGLQRWIASANGRGGPFMGCVLRPEGDGMRLFREARAVGTLSAPASGLWDGRWRVTMMPGDAAPDTVELRALGEPGLHRLSVQSRDGLHPHWRTTGLPQAALSAMPALWQGARLIAAPLALWPNGWQIAARPVLSPEALASASVSCRAAEEEAGESVEEARSIIALNTPRGSLF